MAIIANLKTEVNFFWKGIVATTEAIEIKNNCEKNYR